ncbi:hypothetical protein [Chelativorans alearense]|uniref:hypothetical protein n=1 Tax=Chelativorans alearense TaxID=2681495 RepID=UPI0013D7E6DD|nr:hypothetical protein [Chelativorans alearense]
MIQKTGITLEPRSEHDWDKKRTAWKADLSRFLKNLAKPTSVTADQHETLKAEFEELKQELESLQESYQEASCRRAQGLKDAAGTAVGVDLPPSFAQAAPHGVRETIKALIAVDDSSVAGQRADCRPEQRMAHRLQQVEQRMLGREGPTTSLQT